MKLPNRLKTIFWDVDLKDVDPRKHKDFLIARIAEKGRLKDAMWLRKHFSISVIRRVLNKSKNVSAKTRNFWQVIGN